MTRESVAAVASSGLPAGRHYTHRFASTILVQDWRGEGSPGGQMKGRIAV